MKDLTITSEVADSIEALLAPLALPGEPVAQRTLANGVLQHLRNARRQIEPQAPSTFDDVMRCEESIGSDPIGLDEETVAAWQRIIDSGLAYRLQGMFGRYARDLLNDGIITRGATS